MKESELVELGFYDPEAPNAEERLELLNLALGCGATVDEIRQAIEEDRLHAIPALREIQGGSERLTVAQAAERAGMSLDILRRFWRAIGLTDPEPDGLVCTERDVEALRFLGGLRDIVGDDVGFQFARSMGAAMARLADSEITAVRAIWEAPLRTAGGGNVDVAHELLRAAEALMPGTNVALDVVHRHHLVASARRYSLWGIRPTERSTTDAIVGFADLVGFTTLGSGLDAADLDTLVRRFEDRALDATRRPQSRLVKLIGDEVMFVAGTAPEAVQIVEDLRGDPELPPLRAGIAAGTLLVREGDVFGSVVNLAARLVSIASPGETLLDPEAASRLGVDRVSSLGTRQIAGIDAPVEVFGLR